MITTKEWTAAETLDFELEVFAKILSWWVRFDDDVRTREGLAIDEDVAVFPPQWPNRRVLKAWVRIIGEARAALKNEQSTAPIFPQKQTPRAGQNENGR